MKKRKVKRYQEGGETELKQRGLDLSKDDKVGFVERLKMGNIDDPRSEAYRRFGAGRAKMEIEAKTPVGDANESSDYSGRRMKSFAEDTSNMDVPHSTISDGKPRGVFDTPTMNYEPKAGEKIVEEKKTVTRKPVKKVQKVDDKPVGSMAESSDYSGGRKSAPAAPKSKFSDTGKSVRLNALLKSIPGNPFGLKKGGTVSSASKRADGIAQRGKTKGRIC
jgi:hypothetical protein